MKSAYLYVRVSTDEQKRKGYSLPEQEDRLSKYCETNGILVRGVYREDFSAKNFNRPEWKKLISAIKKDRTKHEKNILFVKWDRFSRNIQYAYEMIGILRKNNAFVMAIDQPVDLQIPESSVMLAVYLSVPEAENIRRGLNTANGLRRARQMGRYPNKAPIGFANIISSDGKKVIVLKEPQAEIVKWVFHQLSQNTQRVETVRKLAADMGLQCSRSHFHRILRNPVYCGLISVGSEGGEVQIVEGNHEGLVTPSLFYLVQDIINTKRQTTNRKKELTEIFFLRGFLKCPLCGRNICGSYSSGSRRKYPYYHCRQRCKTRIDAQLLNKNYGERLRELQLSENAIELFNLVLDDSNLNSEKRSLLAQRQRIKWQIGQQKMALSKARRLFVEGILKIDDYGGFKEEYLSNSENLEMELTDNESKLGHIEAQRQRNYRSSVDIFRVYSDLDAIDKKHLVSLFPPENVNYQTGEISIRLDDPLAKILISNKSKFSRNEFYR